MKIDELYTPAILLDLDALENNIRRYAEEAAKYGKQIWPMLKTHKSLEIAEMQVKAGATGFLCGTLDECEFLAEHGFDNLMYAYPVATKVSIDRVLKLSANCNFIIRIDDLDGAAALDKAAGEAGQKVKYTIIVDSGLHRFGIAPAKVGEFAKKMEAFRNLEFCGISSHSGHVYGVSSKTGVPECAKQECDALHEAIASLKAAGFIPKLVTTGSTPTFWQSVTDPEIGIFHPGNYVFNDAIQLSTETATVEQCALYILASVISHPREDVYICDAGTKCFGLDQGAHGNSSIKGYGHVIGHPELEVDGLSEEVGKLHVHGTTDIKVGDKICIIPNHSCSSANLTSYLIGIRNDEVDHLITVDIRGNSTRKNA